jgi:large subunit ribosomal protein L22
MVDHLRGKTVEQAQALLTHVNKRSVPFLKKLLRSALANAENYSITNRLRLRLERLFVKTIQVDEGPSFKRWRAGARGMANPILRRSSHVTVTLAMPVEEPAKEATAS